MSSRRRFPWWPTLVGSLFLLTLAVLLALRAKAPPEAARLLPESDGIFFANLAPLRALTAWQAPNGASVPMPRSHDFQAFVDATGIVPERDLDSVALALHQMPDPRGPNGRVAYSEVFTGRFNAERLRHYLGSIAAGTETYAGHTIYDIAVEGRTLRVTVLGFDTVAASNMPTPEQIHSMLDRSLASALWRPGSSLLAARYGEVPLLAQAWGIGRIGLPLSETNQIAAMGLTLPFPADADFVASLRYSGDVHLRVEQIAPDALAAERTTDMLNNLLEALRGVLGAQPPANAQAEAARAVLGSVRVQRKANLALLTATVTTGQARLLTASNVPAPNVLPSPANDSAPAR